MPDDRDKKTDEVGGVKDRLRDEFDEATGEKKRKKGRKEPESRDKSPGGVKDRVRDEFEEAAGAKKRESANKDEDA